MHQIRTIAIDGPVAYVSVSLPVCHTGGCVKTDERMEVLLWGGLRGHSWGTLC